MSTLSPDLVRIHDIEPGWRFGSDFDVRWSEIDGFGHVSHRAHLTWCEEARNAYFEALGQLPFHAERPGPVLKEVGFTYEKSLCAGREVVVTARVAWLRNTSFRMEFAAWSDGLVGRGHAICVWFRNSTNALVTLPDELRIAMIQTDHAQDIRGRTSEA
ncbi:acyl-CoA thioesterase [Paraburkholderia sediminicola]|uniref:acyl-CoA thioesterase n=1 Tax=Paraburkholderia sediminicola TaxID=458836 RepID=UPI0038B85B32